MSKKKTRDEYVKELKDKNPNVILIGDYVNTKTNTLHKCLIHNIEWEIAPVRALQGCGCGQCKLERHKISASKTHEQYVEEVKSISPHIIVKEQYINARTPIDHFCVRHNILWKACPGNILKGNGCKECGYDAIGQRLTKTHEQYVEELKQVNPKIIPRERYINANTPILHECLVDNYQWNITPANALSGKQCPKCSHHLSLDLKLYTERLQQINPHLELLGEFIDKDTPTLHLCKTHNIKWNISPISALRGVGCPECIIARNKSKKSHEQYLSELQIINPNIIPIEEYDGATTPILHKCLLDNYEWELKPINALQGSQCPVCSGKLLKTTEDYKTDLSVCNPNLEVIGEYLGLSVPILHKCKTHNIVWNTVPRNALNGVGCPDCCKEKISKALRKTSQQYREELQIINPYVIPLEKYQGASIPILHKCLIDNFEWKTIPSNLLRGSGCPKCNESHGEKMIALWLDNHQIKYVREMKFADCIDTKLLPFDFYIPDCNTCIEYDGEQHFRPVEYFGGEEAFLERVRHDEIKSTYCKNNNIPLLRIAFNEDINAKLNNYSFI